MGKIESVLMRQRAYSLGLGRTMQQIASKPPGVDAVDVLGGGTQCASQSQPGGDDAGHLHRCRCHQPDLLPDVEMQLSERPSTWPDAISDRLLVNLVRYFGHLGDRVPFNKAQCHAADILDVARLLSSNDAEVGLQPQTLHNDSGREEPAPIQALGKLKQRSALNHCVVEIEESRCGRILMDQWNRVIDPCAEIIRGFLQGPGCRTRIVVVNRNCRCVTARQGLDMAEWRGGRTLRLAHRAVRSDHVITIMSSSAVPRARLRWVNDEDTAVQLLDAGRLETNLADLVTRQVEAQPRAVALVQPMPMRRTMTWAELDRRINAVAGGLSAHGLVAGHRIAIVGPNSIEFVVAYFATLRAGYIAVPINPQSTAPELRAMINDCGARVLFTAADQPLEGVHQIDLTPQGLDELSNAAAEPVSSPRDPEALAVLLYTAGTSGEPKAAMLSHRALLNHLDSVASFEILDRDSVVLAMLPLFHVFGLNAVLGSWAMAGARLVIMDGSAGLAEVLAGESITNMPVAPPVLARILDDEDAVASLGSVSTVVSGAAPLPVDLQEQFTARTALRVDQGYGLTEAAPGVSATLGGELLGHGHVGRPLPGVEVRIGDGIEPTEPGEIWIRGDNLFSGYWPDGRGGPGELGWFPTGDVGYQLDGELFLVDRARELIIVNGFNVYPAEVEEAIAELPGVESVAVVGRPYRRTGEQVVAFVTGPGLSVEAVNEYCADRLAKFKRPSLVQLVDELPRGITGKVRKGVLRHSLETVSEKT